MIVLEYYLSLLDTQEEKDKLEQIFLEYGQQIKKNAYKYFKNENDVDDAVGETIMKMIRSLDRFPDPKCHNLNALIVIVVRHACLDMFRKERKNTAVSMEDLTYDPAVTHEDFYRNLSAEIISEEIKKLPRKLSDVVVLKAYYQFSNKEIADLLSIKYATVRKRLERARQLLSHLKKGGGG